jgi:hypothetical protein
MVKEGRIPAVGRRGVNLIPGGRGRCFKEWRFDIRFFPSVTALCSPGGITIIDALKCENTYGAFTNGQFDRFIREVRACFDHGRMAVPLT